MKLCFDATRFGAGLEGAIDIASQKGIPCVEYSFEPFPAGGKTGRDLKSKERKYLESVAALSQEKGVEIACLNLLYSHNPGDKNSKKKFLGMMEKLSKVAAVLKCKFVSFYLEPGADEGWKAAFEEDFAELLPIMQELDVVPLLKLSTPSSTRRLSLKKWRAMEPQDWRDLLSGCSGLSLSFSPADCVWLGIDYLQILSGFNAAIEHVEANDVEINRQMLKDSGMFGPLWWRYRIPGKGVVDWSQLIELLKLYEYKGTFSIQLDDEFVAGDLTSLEGALDDGVKKLAPLFKG